MGEFGCPDSFSKVLHVYATSVSSSTVLAAQVSNKLHAFAPFGKSWIPSRFVFMRKVRRWSGQIDLGAKDSCNVSGLQSACEGDNRGVQSLVVMIFLILEYNLINKVNNERRAA